MAGAASRPQLPAVCSQEKGVRAALGRVAMVGRAEGCGAAAGRTPLCRAVEEACGKGSPGGTAGGISTGGLCNCRLPRQGTVELRCRPPAMQRVSTDLGGGEGGRGGGRGLGGGEGGLGLGGGERLGLGGGGRRGLGGGERGGDLGDGDGGGNSAAVAAGTSWRSSGAAPACKPAAAFAL